MSRKIVNKNRFITSIIVIFLVFLAVIFLFNKISGSSKADRKNAAEQVAEKEVIPDKYNTGEEAAQMAAKRSFLPAHDPRVPAGIQP